MPGRGPAADPRSGEKISAAGLWTPRTMTTQHGEGGGEQVLQVVAALPGITQLQGPPTPGPNSRALPADWAGTSRLPHPVLLGSKPCQCRENRADPCGRAMISAAGFWRSWMTNAYQGGGGGGRQGKQVLDVVTDPQGMMQLQGPPMPAPSGLPPPGLLGSKLSRGRESGADPHGAAVISAAALWTPGYEPSAGRRRRRVSALQRCVSDKRSGCCGCDGGRLRPWMREDHCI